MAYSGAVTVERRGSEILVSITETEAAAASEADAIDIGVQKGRILRQKCVLTAGTGTTVDPILGTATNPSGASVVVENGTAAATVDNQVVGGVPFYTSTGNLYHRSVVDAAADNSITTEYLILVGWGQ